MKNMALGFYDCSKPNYHIPVLIGQRGEVEHRNLELPTNGIFVGDELPKELTSKLGEAIETLYSSIKPVTVKHDGIDYTFEIGHIPASQNIPGGEQESVLRSATYQSSLTGNKGNGFETAVDSVFTQASQ